MIIVTGGAGFIGSAIVWQLNQRGIDDILIIDHLRTCEKWKNLVPLKYADYIEKDDFLKLLGDDELPASIDASGRGVEAIIHMGACSATTERDATYLVRNNFEYSKHMALLAQRLGSRFIYASSAATYGDGEDGFKDEENALETLRPLNMYGYSKQMFDLWMQRNGLLSQSVGLKFFNVFGPNEYHKDDMSSLVLKAVEQIQSTGKLKLFRSHRPEYKDGEQKRDFVYVKDVVDMVLFFMDNRKASGIFNIGGGSAHSWNDLAEAIFSALNKTVNVEYIDMPESIRDRYQYYTCAEMDKIKKAGYKGQGTSLKSAVEDYVVNYLLQNKTLGF